MQRHCIDSRLITAIDHDPLESFIQLVEANNIDINKRCVVHETDSLCNFTWLALASKKGRQDIVKHLLNRPGSGAPLELLRLRFYSPDHEGFTAYELALMEGHAEVATLLKPSTEAAKLKQEQSRQAEIKELGTKALDYKEKKQTRAYQYTLQRVHQLQQRPEIDKKLSKERLSYLYFSAAKNKQGHKTLKLLFELENIPVTTTNWEGRTALHLAVANNQLETVKFLVEQKANVEAQDNEGNTPLLSLSESNENTIHIVKYLIEAKADPKAVNKKGQTILHKVECPEAVEYLLNLCPELVNIQDSEGRSPLMHFLNPGLMALDKTDARKKIATFMIGSKANLELTTKSHPETALLFTARTFGFPQQNDLMKLLIESRANLDAKNFSGESTYDLVTETHDPKKRAEGLEILRKASGGAGTANIAAGLGLGRENVVAGAAPTDTLNPSHTVASSNLENAPAEAADAAVEHMDSSRYTGAGPGPGNLR